MTTHSTKGKIKEIQEILIAIVDEMYVYGHFISSPRAMDLIKKIERLNK
jgi:hypothetical protein